MIPNGRIHKNKIAPVHVPASRKNHESEGDDEFEKTPGVEANGIPLRPRHRSSHSRKARGISSFEAAGRVKLGFTRWKLKALDEKTMPNKGNQPLGSQRARGGMSKLGIPNKLNYHRMNAAQLSDLEELVDETIVGKRRERGGKKSDGQRQAGRSINSSSRALILYFSKLSANINENEVIDLEFVDTLIKTGADINTTDRHGQTIMHEASRQWEVDVARFLIEREADAKEALDQFYSKDRANRKQFFHLNYLEPAIPKCLSCGWPQTAMEVVVLHKQFDLIMHPVFQRLIKVKWEHFGKRGAWLQSLAGVVFVILWTIFGVTTVGYGKYDYYTQISKSWWRIVIGSVAILMTLNEIRRELFEYYFSKKEHRRWKRWREAELYKDLEYCHPRWPGERLYLMQEIDILRHQEPTYFKDAWNIFDWISYFLILASMITHFVAIFTDYRAMSKIHTNVMSATVICLWIRLLKIFRAFTSLGPFVVMCGHLIFDVLKFGFLFIIFYVPYAASFWMVFSNHSVSGYSEVSDLLYSMFRMTVVDEYNYDGLSEAEPIMSKILCGTYIALSAITCLNLFIALMSDTFQRVYDNVKANSVMQQANTITNLENSLSVTKRRNFANFIHTRCCPDELYYDDDIVDDEEGDLKRMTHQIKEGLDEVHEILKVPKMNKNGRNNASTSEVEQLLSDIKRLEEQQLTISSQFNAQFDEIKELLAVVISKQNRRKKRSPLDEEIPAPASRNVETL
ncbi:transient receptor potential cation channel subfamily V member 4-like [Actinia tenebrosa]|uniref:Transient receptor potential cation channel subfamily V member 4-like n=1 Tax=Actinia tenebrosa TaxID=6105 RepID=A0A6P8HRL3_ACTTE|nr:transient receptor potential cation channel subfamily V member 4-like [Actinia tenebrosa]